MNHQIILYVDKEFGFNDEAGLVHIGLDMNAEKGWKWNWTERLEVLRMDGDLY